MNAFDLLARTDPAQLALFILILSIPGAVAGILAGALLNRAAFGVLRIIGRFFRALFWPVRAVLRLFGIKMLAKSRPARIALIGVDSIARGRPDHLSEIEWALRQPDEAESETDAPPNASSFYDFKDEEHLLRKQGRIFKWFRIPGEYIPRSLAAPFTNEISDRYLAQGRRFFRRPIELNVNPNALYEDAEGAVIVSLFRESDRRCFYALDQLRRVINRNALQLVLWLAVCLAAAMVSTWGALNADASWRWLLAAGAVVAALAAFFFQLLYANQQRQNMREFSDFLTRYLGLIS
ncbi:MAG TPA: hypothetical protein VNH64_08490, partial [Parvularculaceae bacterium]|nr:hypothetical protein [Parvularculaceae bacterium]